MQKHCSEKKTEEEFWEELDRTCDIEKQWLSERQERIKKTKEFKEEVLESSFGEAMRKSREIVLKDRIRFLEWECLRLNEWIEKDFKQHGSFFTRQSLNGKLKWVEQILKKHLMETRTKQKQGKITDEMIVRAREYPIENLIEVNSRGFAICPYHDDTKPSMLVRNGFAYCFSCQTSKDPIALAMDTKGLNFVDAVKFLNNMI